MLAVAAGRGGSDCTPAYSRQLVITRSSRPSGAIAGPARCGSRAALPTSRDGCDAVSSTRGSVDCGAGQCRGAGRASRGGAVSPTQGSVVEVTVCPVQETEEEMAFRRRGGDDDAESGHGRRAEERRVALRRHRGHGTGKERVRRCSRTSTGDRRPLSIGRADAQMWSARPDKQAEFGFGVAGVSFPVFGSVRDMLCSVGVNDLTQRFMETDAAQRVPDVP